MEYGKMTFGRFFEPSICVFSKKVVILHSENQPKSITRNEEERHEPRDSL